jgi:eukaryotic-like serine/threonine-protein kinase
VLHTSLEGDDIGGFLREAQTVARLKHPHIVRVFDFDVENHTPFLVMDYLPNGNVRRLHPKGTPLPLQTIFSYVTQVASALQHAHDEKLIHRYIKPENMLLDQDNTLVLSDFGIALTSQGSRYQSLQEVAGTAAYMAPEQFQRHPRRASDQYAPDMVVYEWLTGDRPFHGSFSEIASQHLFVPPPPLHEKVPTIPPGVEQVVMTALVKDPKERFASVRAFATALEQASQTAQIAPSTPSRQGTLSRKPALSGEKVAAIVSSELSQAASMNTPSSQFTPPVPAGMPSRPSLARHWIVIGLALLIISVSLGLFNIIRTPQITASNASPSTSSVNANRAASATTAVTATALYNTYVWATSGTPAIDDPLSNNSNGWGEFTTNWGGACSFTGGAYHLSIAKPGFWVWCTGRGMDLNNFAMQVQMSITKGDDGSIVFGQTTKGFYRVDVSSAGMYTLLQYTQNTNQTSTLRFGFSPAIKTGLNQVNVITVIVNNNHFYFYVNQQFVTDATLSTFSQGYAGFASVGNSQPDEVVFRNVNVWLL